MCAGKVGTIDIAWPCGNAKKTQSISSSASGSSGALTKFRFGKAEQISVHFADRFSGVLVCRDEHEFDIRMEEQDTEQL